MKFVVGVYHDEDGAFISECPSTPGGVSQGQTEAEAASNIADAIRECLAVRAELGMPLTVTMREAEAAGLMPALPLLRPREVVLAFEALVGRLRGGHCEAAIFVATKPGAPATLSIPDHAQVARGPCGGRIPGDSSMVTVIHRMWLPAGRSCARLVPWNAPMS
jgi:predicted RNase H-like HicB family nuclease